MGFWRLHYMSYHLPKLEPKSEIHVGLGWYEYQSCQLDMQTRDRNKR